MFASSSKFPNFNFGVLLLVSSFGEDPLGFFPTFLVRALLSFLSFLKAKWKLFDLETEDLSPLPLFSHTWMLTKMDEQVAIVFSPRAF